MKSRSLPTWLEPECKSEYCSLQLTQELTSKCLPAIGKRMMLWVPFFKIDFFCTLQTLDMIKNHIRKCNMRLQALSQKHIHTWFPPSWSEPTSCAVNLAIEIDFTLCVNSRLEIKTKSSWEERKLNQHCPNSSTAEYLNKLQFG